MTVKGDHDVKELHQLVQQVTHETGFLRATVVPVSNLNAIASIKDDECATTITGLVESAKRVVNRQRPFLCASCLGDAGGKRTAAYLFMEFVPTGDKEFHALCRKCGHGDAVLKRALRRLAGSYAQDIYHNTIICEVIPDAA